MASSSLSSPLSPPPPSPPLPLPLPLSSLGVQWYQTATHVTASLLRPRHLPRGLPAEATCDGSSLTLLFDGTEHWSCALAEEVLPASLRCRSGQVRCELKVEKKRKTLWQEFEDRRRLVAKKPPTTVASVVAAALEKGSLSTGLSTTAPVSHSHTNGTVPKADSIPTGNDFAPSDTQSSCHGNGDLVVPVSKFDNDGNQSHQNNTQVGHPPIFKVTKASSCRDNRKILNLQVPTSNGKESETRKQPDKKSTDSVLKLRGGDLPTDMATGSGLVGLANLGNSCFMNSVVQCLSHTKVLRNYFLSRDYKEDVNQESRFGFEGQLAYSFAALVRLLWNTEAACLKPKNLIHLLRGKNNQLQSGNQQDAQEFMVFFLDRLSEDLNRVRAEPAAISPVKNQDRKDWAVAEESLRKHKLRNDSFVEDLFLGQFRSTLECLACQSTSVVFDAYMTIVVPLPGKMAVRTVTFVPLDPALTPIKYLIKISEEASAELLKAAVAKKANVPPRTLKVFEDHDGQFQTAMSKKQLPIKSIHPTDSIMASEVNISQEYITISAVQRLQVVPSECGSCGAKKQRARKCSACKQVAYCNVECQTRDWQFHRQTCVQYRTGARSRAPAPGRALVGCPFVLCLPREECSYQSIAERCQLLARRSVYVRQIEDERPQSGPTPHTDSSNRSSGQEERLNETEAEKKRGDSSKPPENETFRPFFLSFVTQSGVTTQLDISPEDCTPANLSEHYLAVDWDNDISKKPYMEVLSKEVECDEDSSMRKQSSSDNSKPVSLEECLELFTEPEMLTKGNSWYCPKCKGPQDATKHLSVWSLPQLLILTLKRFQYHQGQRADLRQKIDRFVKFPLTGLDMMPYLLGDARQQVSSTYPLYDLYAVINHYGDPHWGHYTAHVKSAARPQHRGGEWHCFDDGIVRACSSAQEVVTKDAYVLFYKRRD